MKIEKHSKAFLMAMDKIPQLVAELAEWEGVKKQIIQEEVCQYSSSGSMFGRSLFTIDADDMLDHIKKAKKRIDCTVEFCDNKVTIKRTMSNKEYCIATYTPITA